MTFQYFATTALAASMLIIAVAPRDSFAGDGFAADLAAYNRAQTTAERVRAVRRMARLNAKPAVLALAKIVRGDTDQSVRVEAARALGGIDAPDVTKKLRELVSGGGTHEVRKALAKSLGMRSDGVEKIKRTLASRRTETAVKLLLVRALEFVPGQEARRALESLVTSEDGHLRPTALAALGGRRDARAMLPSLVEMILDEHDDVDTQAECLEVARRFSAEELDVLLPLLPRVKHSSLARLVEHLKELRDHLRRKQLEELNKGTPYERHTDDGHTTSWLPRYGSVRIDVVYAFDTTYSERSTLAGRKRRIKQEVRLLEETGADVRVGYVSYRDVLRDRRESKRDYQVRVFPLTRDIAASEAWLDGIEAYGVGESRASISIAFASGLDKMNWRRDAARSLHLLASTGCDDLPRCRKTVRLHSLEDRVKLRIRATSGVRTRKDMTILAKDAGTRLEFWRDDLQRRF